MPTTSNFGWNTPADTDLVKDGALAIRTLGNAIDSSMAELKGGTTGQVLSKTSNTDMDFTWVTQDDANAIQNAIVDAKGDLITATANDTPARLAVGSNGDTLVADSAASTGLRWSPAPSTGNPIINSSFNVWQRGTSFAGAGTTNYTADRWVGYRAVAGSTFSRQTTGDTTNLPFIQYCARVQRNSGNSATNSIQLGYGFESVDSIPYAGKTVTLSFYARRGADFSASSNNLNVLLQTGTGTDQNIVAGMTGNINLIDTTQALTTTWTRYSFTATISASATQIGIQLYYVPAGTAGAADFFEATGVQLDLGSVALPYRRASSTIQGETALCQRYYFRATSPSAAYNRFALGQCVSATVATIVYPFPVTMRTAPTALEQSGTANHYAMTSATASVLGCSSVPTFENATVNQGSVLFTISTSSLTAGHATQALANNTASAYLGWSAEL